jgi:hypothetical protein
MNKSFHTIKGERRSGCDRRHFSYAIYLPERRLAKDRRYSIKIPRCTIMSYDFIFSTVEYMKNDERLQSS